MQIRNHRLSDSLPSQSAIITLILVPTATRDMPSCLWSNTVNETLSVLQLEAMPRNSSKYYNKRSRVDFSDDDYDDGYEHLIDEQDDDEPVLSRGRMVPAPEPGRNPTGGFF